MMGHDYAETRTADSTVPVFSLLIFLSIFDELDVPTILNCTLICRPMRNAIVSSTTLQYRFALFAANLTDPMRYKGSITEKLEHLTRYRLAWNSMTSKNAKVVPIPPVNLLPSPIFHLRQGILSWNSASRELSFLRIPFALVHPFRKCPQYAFKTSEDRVRPHLVPFDISAFAVDFQSDLVVGYERGQLQFLHLSTAKPHIQAYNTALQLESMPFLEISGNRVIAHIPRQWLILIDWMSATRGHICLHGPITGFMMLDSGVLLIAASEEGGVPRLLTVDLTRLEPGQSYNIYSVALHTFLLPSPLQYLPRMNIILQAGLSPTSSEYDTTDSANLSSESPETSTFSHDDALLLLQIETFTHSHDRTYISVLPSDLFARKHDGSLDFRRAKQRNTLCTPWQVWSTRASIATLKDAKLAVHGTRMVVVYNQGDQGVLVVCYDFNRHRIKRLTQETEDATHRYYQTLFDRLSDVKTCQDDFEEFQKMNGCLDNFPLLDHWDTSEDEDMLQLKKGLLDRRCPCVWNVLESPLIGRDVSDVWMNDDGIVMIQGDWHASEVVIFTF